MKKEKLYNIGKKDYLLDDILIEKIILKNLKISKNSLFLLSEMDEKDIDNILSDFEKYNSGYPIEYILGKAEFYGLEFVVDNRVLIPRNDTEIMVSKVVEILKFKVKSDEKITLIDVGTGSACIPISIVKNVDNSQFKTFALDISENALEVAKINIENHNLQNNIELLQSNLLEIFLNSKTSILKPQFSTLIITANLPYIKNEDYENMDDGVFFFEPNVALFGGKKTGFEMYETLINQVFELKSQYNIILFIEIGFDQYDISKKFLENKNLSYEYFKDMSGIDRMIRIEF